MPFDLSNTSLPFGLSLPTAPTHESYSCNHGTFVAVAAAHNSVGDLTIKSTMEHRKGDASRIFIRLIIQVNVLHRSMKYRKQTVRQGEIPIPNTPQNTPNEYKCHRILAPIASSMASLPTKLPSQCVHIMYCTCAVHPRPSIKLFNIL